MALMWNEDPLGQLGPQTSCRGCGRGLWPRGANWADADGIEVCVKAPLAAVGQGERPDFVLHEPMPAGLRGAPA